MLAATAPSTRATDDSPALRVYTSGSYLPLHGVNAGRPIGIEPEIAEVLARALGRKLVFVDRAAGGDGVSAVASGKADVALNAVTPTAARGERVDFTAPYAEVELRLAARAGVGVPRLEQLAGYRVAVPQGVALEQARAAKLPGKVLPVPSVGDALAALAWGEAEFAVGEDVALLAALRGSEFELVGPPVARSPIAMAAPKGRGAEYDALLARLAPEIAAVKARWRRHFALRPARRRLRLRLRGARGPRGGVHGAGCGADATSRREVPRRLRGRNVRVWSPGGPDHRVLGNRGGGARRSEGRLRADERREGARLWRARGRGPLRAREGR